MSIEEQYKFTKETKKKLLITAVVGIIIAALGIVMTMTSGGHGEGEHALLKITEKAVASSETANEAVVTLVKADEGEHGSPLWLKKIFVSLWMNNVFFVGIAIIGVFFVALQYAAQAGWSANIKRIPEAFGYWLPIGGVIMLALFFLAGHDIFHWTHVDVYDPASSNFDSIINGKKAYFFWPLDENPGFPIFYIARMIIFFAVWYWLFLKIRKYSLQEDIEGGTSYWFKMRSLSAIFLVVFAVSSSIAAWDWLMSIDVHWFSTMYGWYIFASWFVTGLAVITLFVVYLKDAGYLSVVSHEHLHDLGKFVWAFSIFWTYIWFGQFLLIYYANIPEESIYFLERINSGNYAWVFYMNLIFNFFLPFLLLMTRDAKRHRIFLKMVCMILVAGHWFDFYLMVTPGTLQGDGSFGFLEIGITMIFAAAFLFVALRNLEKAPLVAKNHPMLQESLHHHT